MLPLFVSDNLTPQTESTVMFELQQPVTAHREQGNSTFKQCSVKQAKIIQCSILTLPNSYSS